MIGLSKMSGWNVGGRYRSHIAKYPLARTPGHKKDTPQNSKREHRGRHCLFKPAPFLFHRLFTPPAAGTCITSPNLLPVLATTA